MNLAAIAIRGSSGLHPEVETFISASYANITDAGIITDLNNLVGSLKTNGLWTMQKAIYPIVGGNANAHRYNLKDVTQYPITWIGTLTHDANGVTGSGSGYGNTFIYPSADLSLNNTHIGCYVNSGNNVGAYCDMGTCNASNTNMLAMYIYTSGFQSYVNDNGYVGVAPATNTGFYVASRHASNGGRIYKNGTNIGNTGVTSAARSTAPLTLLALNNNGSISNVTNRRHAFYTVGDSLNDTQASNLYTAIQAFQTARGRQV